MNIKKYIGFIPNKLDRATSLLSNADEHIGLFAGALALVTAVITTYDVFMRYFLNRPTLWVSDIVPNILLISIAFLALSYSFKKGGLVAVDVIYNRLPLKHRTIISLLSCFVGLLFVGALAWAGWDSTSTAVKMGYKTYVMGIPILFSKIWIPIGCFFLLFRLLLNTFNTVRSLTEQMRNSVQLAHNKKYD